MIVERKHRNPTAEIQIAGERSIELEIQKETKDGA